MLRLGRSGPIEMFGFSDASHITSGKSKSRYVGALFLGLDSGALLVYKSVIIHSPSSASQIAEKNANGLRLF